VDVSGGFSVVSINGEIDMSNVAELQAALERAADGGALGVAVDLSRSSYFDSRTIATLAAFASRMRISRQRVALVAPAQEFSGKVLRVAGLQLVVPTYDQLADALAALKEPP
jgi:anti-anti-sigma factor